MSGRSVTLAATRVESVYFGKEGTPDERYRYLEQAGRDGADIVVFPETYFPDDPHWRRGVSTSISIPSKPLQTNCPTNRG
ncbi:hypothetical protein Harman_32470 [Haloarcula mannanilytica]|uniref:CN hydrolase domain-containing protein n=1 Tax=Haloarcula mannanilytica TaxID=2509225 RepID=A0A4C2ELZ1_9EURY|nr:hypothetical protein [Haloarcula mannanilytica]GCF15312.1 hypothetical protein Harman_32470 [Haloarcula mannanilytica]